MAISNAIAVELVRSLENHIKQNGSYSKFSFERNENVKLEICPKDWFISTTARIGFQSCGNVKTDPMIVLGTDTLIDEQSYYANVVCVKRNTMDIKFVEGEDDIQPFQFKLSLQDKNVDVTATASAIIDKMFHVARTNGQLKKDPIYEKVVREYAEEFIFKSYGMFCKPCVDGESFRKFIKACKHRLVIEDIEMAHEVPKLSAVAVDEHHIYFDMGDSIEAFVRKFNDSHLQRHYSIQSYGNMIVGKDGYSFYIDDGKLPVKEFGFELLFLSRHTLLKNMEKLYDK